MAGGDDQVVIDFSVRRQTRMREMQCHFLCSLPSDAAEPANGIRVQG